MRIDLALEFVKNCSSSASVEPLVAEFRARILDFGFTASVCGAWTGIGKHRAGRFYFNDWPQSWLELYERQNFFADDPYVAEARRRMTPYRWAELERQPHMTDRMREIFATAREYGWREVLGIPIHGPAGYQGLVSLATQSDVTLDAESIAILQLMALAIHARCRSAVDFGQSTLDRPELTAREIECLRWAASGKTDWEIAQLLGIAAPTAHFHIERAKKKLGVTSRVQAVALMVLSGLI